MRILKVFFAVAITSVAMISNAMAECDDFAYECNQPQGFYAPGNQTFVQGLTHWSAPVNDPSYGGGYYTQTNYNPDMSVNAGAVHRADGVIEVYQAGSGDYGGGYSTQTNYVGGVAVNGTVFRNDGFQEVYSADGSQQNYKNGVLCYDSNNVAEYGGCE